METIPSHLSREMNSTGAGCFVIVNLGVEGYVTNQKLILLVNALKTGERPDVVIFFDGVNEALAAASSGTSEMPSPHLEFQSIKARMESSLTSALDFLRDSNALEITRAIAARLRSGDSRASPPANVAARAGAALDNYQANVRVLRNLG